MSYVDLIIKYLSGDLSQEEAVSFEKELESNDALKKAFDEHSAAYELIRDQLQKRDEQAFSAKLLELVNRDAPPIDSREVNLRSWWYIPPIVACSLAILLLVLFNPSGNERLVKKYYHPETDPFVQACYQDTRGENENGISQYRQGNYCLAMELLSHRITLQGDNKMILLYYLLSAMELDRQKEVLEHVKSEPVSPMEMLDQSICWYSTLALIKSGKRETALEKIHLLSEQEGLYQNDAIKLEKILLK